MLCTTDIDESPSLWDTLPLEIKEIIEQYCYEEDDNPGYARKVWKQGKNIHRDKDLPAIIFLDGDMLWYQEGVLHRDNDRPAIVLYKDGDDGSSTMCWYQRGLLQRANNKPAVVYAKGQEWFYIHGHAINNKLSV